ncbi:lasso RiPP family leader peptide-containing protein [Streptomyces sp. NPDC007971]
MEEKEQKVYVPPALEEVGDFTEETLGWAGTNWEPDFWWGI